MEQISRKYQFLYGSAICCTYTALLLGLEIFLNNGVMNNDAYFYIQSADAARSQGIGVWYNNMVAESQYPPLLLICMIFFSKSTSLSLELAGRVLNVIPCLIAACGVFCCCRLLYKKFFMALVTALLVMSLPGWFNHGSGIVRDPLYWMETIWLFVAAISVKDFQNDDRKKLWLALCIGIVAGLMLLTRKEAISLIIPGIILFFCELTNLYREPLKNWCYHILLGVLILVVAGMIAFLPYFCGINFIPIKALIVHTSEIVL